MGSSSGVSGGDIGGSQGGSGTAPAGRGSAGKRPAKAGCAARQDPVVPASGVAGGGVKRGRRTEVKLVALDMDGTLLNSSSKILRSSVEAVRAACDRGVTVILATGKARPAAIRACEAVGLAGPGLLVHPKGPGIFLQGLAVHGRDGRQLTDAQLPAEVVEKSFRYVQERYPDGHVSLVAFTGDNCSTLRMTDDVQALHDVYYEPLANVCTSLDDLMSGPPVRKLLFMTSPKVVDQELKPYWLDALKGSGAAPIQAVPNMLEVVPDGVDKWVGLQVLLRHLDVTREQFMAVGDGGNDLQMVANAGIGVAMANAVPKVKEAATCVVKSHDDDGVAEAFERFVL